MEGNMASGQKQYASIWLKFNVRGMTFITKSSTLQRFPETLLGRLTSSSEFYKEDIDTFVFDRNPILFQHILDFYRDGHLHFPNNLCGSSIQDEINFWQIKESDIAPCCWRNYQKEKKEDKVLNQLGSVFDTVDRFEHDRGNQTYAPAIREKIWLLMEDSASSCGAKAKAVVYTIFVWLSLSLLSLESEPVFQQYLYLDDNLNVKEGSFPGFYYAECFISCLFAIELVLRFIVSPSKKRFLLNFYNIMNLLVILLQLSACIIALQDTNMRFERLCWMLSMCRLFRILLVYKIAMHFTPMRIVGLALKNCFKELLWVLLFYSLTIFLFATIIYSVEMNQEHSQFRSITAGTYWAFITMTTVGYGDITPVSSLGRLISGTCALIGILFNLVIMIIFWVSYDTYQKQTDLKNTMDEKRKVENIDDKKC